MGKKKILFIINSLHFGGAERVASQLINNLCADYDIHLALYHRIIDYELNSTVNIVDLKENKADGNIKIFLRLPVIAHKLKTHCNKHEIGMVISFLNRPCYIAAIMKSVWGYKGKMIMCERSYQSNILNIIGGGSKAYKMISKKLIHFSYQRANIVLTNSKVSKLDLQQNFFITTPITVIYNPLNIEQIIAKSQERVDAVFEEGYFYFISAGNFRPEKRFDILLNAFALLKNHPVKLILIGGGALSNNLNELVTYLEIRDKVIFTGFDANPYKYISKAHCFVLSSYTEGFPNVLLEALACQKPVVSTDCKSGPRELLAPQTPIDREAEKGYELAEYGILTAVNDPAALADGMLKIYKDKQLREELQAKASSRARMFDIALISYQYKDVINSLYFN